MAKKAYLIFWGFFFSIIFLSSILSFVSEQQLNPLDYARITDVEYQAIVYDEPDSEGSMFVREVLTFDIHAASRNNLFWELWRDLPEEYIDGVKVDYDVISVRQLLPNGDAIEYKESPKLYWEDEDYESSNYRFGPGKWFHSGGPYNESARRYECVFFYVDGLYREEVVFELVYKINNAALRYNDCSDLYLALYSEETINHLESYKAEILFPNKDMPSSGNFEYYTYGTNANEFPVTESADKYEGYYTFSIELDEEDLQFKPYNEYLEFELVSYNEDKHIFAENAPHNLYTSDDVLWEIREEYENHAQAPAKFRIYKLITLILMTVTGAGILLYAFRTDARMKKKHSFYEPAEKLEYYRDIPCDLDPNFAAALVFCKHKAPKDDSGIYSAILLSLARKKYIELEEFGDDVMISLTNPPKPAEPDYSLFQQSDSVLGARPIGYYASQQNSSANSTASVGSDSTQTANTDSTASAVPEEKPEPLTPCEESYYNLLVRHITNGRITMRYFQDRVTSDYVNTDAFAKTIEHSVVNIGISEGYFQKADYTQPKDEIQKAFKVLLITGILFVVLVNLISCQTRMDFAFGAFFIFGIACLISSFYLRTQANKYILLTQMGEDQYEKWRGLYNFLNSETLINERTMVELPIWEKYLVYATAFGISEKVVRAISIRCPEIPPTSGSMLGKSYYRSGRYHRTGRSFRSAVRSGSHSARSGGYGYGFGGGGRGGGGGGGGH